MGIVMFISLYDHACIVISQMCMHRVCVCIYIRAESASVDMPACMNLAIYRLFISSLLAQEEERPSQTMFVGPLEIKRTCFHLLVILKPT